jgi:TMEM175 potassium channel family protein
VTPRSTEERREAQRLEAFSDGVMAVVITIMVLNLNVPSDTTWHALGDQLPSLLVYVLSFALIGTYWNNHHHLLRATEHISGAVMWANLHLLFWLSLIPLATKWVGEAHKASLPASVYGIVSLGAALAYLLLVRTIIQANGRDSQVARAIGSDVKGKLSTGLFAAGIGLAWVSPWVAYAIYVAVVVQWLVPDRRFVRSGST